MRPRTLLILLAVACALLWWQATRRPAAPPGASAVGITTHAPSSRCPLPPRVERGRAPLQTDVPGGLRLAGLDDAGVQALAGFSIDARVLAREDYSMDREADYSPIDLALGWGRMADDAVLDGLDISQGGRWYRYSWKDQPPIPVDEIVRSSANMHMVPADDTVAAALERIERGQRVRIDGWLVQIDANDGWHWRSSLTREDSGGGACELVYVCAVTAP